MSVTKILNSNVLIYNCTFAQPILVTTKNRDIGYKHVKQFLIFNCTCAFSTPYFLACKVGVFWSAIHHLFSGMTLSHHLGRQYYQRVGTSQKLILRERLVGFK